ncbi:MAG TPA: DUF1203 domain-containing protein [Kofleriaceae bacterium]|nr:DUF1203 domain-containing protein [Kofleriaceae bacterium]
MASLARSDEAQSYEELPWSSIRDADGGREPSPARSSSSATPFACSPIAADRALDGRGGSGSPRPASSRIPAGTELAALIERLFADADTAYLHVHNARPGCYAARVDRA